MPHPRCEKTDVEFVDKGGRQTNQGKCDESRAGDKGESLGEPVEHVTEFLTAVRHGNSEGRSPEESEQGG